MLLSLLVVVLSIVSSVCIVGFVDNGLLIVGGVIGILVVVRVCGNCIVCGIDLMIIVICD